MGGSETKSHSFLPLQILVNYWELKPTQMAVRLDALSRAGHQRIAAFVPWQAFEADIAHQLTRFISAVRERRMKVDLLMTPELGMHYANSGIPKDFFKKPENFAKNADGSPCAVTLPPNIFSLPSALSSDFSKRYQNLLTRMDAFFADVQKSGGLDGVSVVFTGSFWKYYRPAGRGFEGVNGDFSGVASVAYRQALETFYSQREFQELGPAAANRWKARALDEINRMWFFQHSEDVFRSRTFQATKRRAIQLQVSEIELFVPEADPAYSLASLASLLSGDVADFSLLSSLLDEYQFRTAAAVKSSVHWTGLGAFRGLSDPEKQYLILKSLLLFAGREGSVLVDDEEWFKLSPAFRVRVEAMARSFEKGEFKTQVPLVYLAPHAWSTSTQGAPLWETLKTASGQGVCYTASVEAALSKPDVRMIVVDPELILRRAVLEPLLKWLRAGEEQGVSRGARVLILPRSSLYTESARALLERVLETESTESPRSAMWVKIGLQYQIQMISARSEKSDVWEGLKTGDRFEASLSSWAKLVVYDPPNEQDAREGYKTFIQSMMSFIDMDDVCKLSDARLRQVRVARPDGSLGLFVLNESARAIQADLVFKAEVWVGDLTQTVQAQESQANRPVQVGELPTYSVAALKAPGMRFQIDVPPFGVLPILVEGLGKDAEERRAARASEAILREGLNHAAMAELPGFDPQLVTEMETELEKGETPWI